MENLLFSPQSLIFHLPSKSRFRVTLNNNSVAHEFFHFQVTESAGSWILQQHLPSAQVIQHPIVEWMKITERERFTRDETYILRDNQSVSQSRVAEAQAGDSSGNHRQGPSASVSRYRATASEDVTVDTTVCVCVRERERGRQRPVKCSHALYIKEWNKSSRQPETRLQSHAYAWKLVSEVGYDWIGLDWVIALKAAMVRYIVILQK
jgi:hypothetical protein